jgi:hypothetical protein
MGWVPGRRRPSGASSWRGRRRRLPGSEDGRKNKIKYLKNELDLAALSQTLLQTVIFEFS